MLSVLVNGMLMSGKVLLALNGGIAPDIIIRPGKLIPCRNGKKNWQPRMLKKSVSRFNLRKNFSNVETSFFIL